MFWPLHTEVELGVFRFVELGEVRLSTRAQRPIHRTHERWLLVPWGPNLQLVGVCRYFSRLIGFGTSSRIRFFVARNMVAEN